MNKYITIQYGDQSYTGKIKKLSAGKYVRNYTNSTSDKSKIRNTFGVGLYLFVSNCGNFNTCWIELNDKSVYPFSPAIFNDNLSINNHTKLQEHEITALKTALKLLKAKRKSESAQEIKKLLATDKRIADIRKHRQTIYGCLRKANIPYTTIKLIMRKPLI